MRIHVNHVTVYRYDPPANGAIQILRLTPRSHDGQYVVSWRIDVSESCRLAAHEDAFGNLTHTFALDGPINELQVTVDGEVETQDTAGMVRGMVERFPPSLYTRTTELTAADDAIRAFAETSVAGGGDPLARMHTLMGAINDAMSYDPDPTHASTSAAEAFKLKRGVCQDFAHVLVAAGRHLGVPARYVSGYLVGDGALPAQNAGHQAGHAWAELHIEGYGWIGFDAAHNLCPTDAYVRVAVGLDYLGAAPVRGNRYGGGQETLTVALKVDQSTRQVQG